MRRPEADFWKIIVSGFGMGYSTFAPGTTGAIGALIPFVLLVNYSGDPYLWTGLLIIIFTIAGISGMNRLQGIWQKDPPECVVDEMVGMWISVMWTGSSAITIISAFVLFRVFDIFKPLGIKNAERLPGGTGVMADDILAGVYTNIIIQITGFGLRTFL